MTFIQSPFFTMSSIFKYPDPKTMAFGGVATGCINAQEAATVAPTNKKSGCTSMACARDAKTGNIRAVLAIFDVISVIKFTEAIMISSPLSSQNPSTLSALKFYPNPVNSNYVRFNPPFQSPGTVTVYDVLGAVVFKTLIKNQILDVSRLSAGIYSMKIESGNLSIIKKIIKQ